MDKLFDIVEQHLRKMTMLEHCEARPRTDWGVSGDPFEAHLFAAFILPDCEQFNLDFIQCHVDTIAENMRKAIDEFDLAEFYPLSAAANSGVQQKLFNEEQNMPARVSIAYDAIRKGTQITVDVLLRQIGNWYYPIIGGPMDQILFPFKNVPYEGQNISFQFDMNPRGDYTIYGDYEGEEDRTWPGLDLRLVHRQRSTLHNYRFNMPYVYYMGETLL